MRNRPTKVRVASFISSSDARLANVGLSVIILCPLLLRFPIHFLIPLMHFFFVIFHSLFCMTMAMSVCDLARTALERKSVPGLRNLKQKEFLSFETSSVMIP